MRIKTALSASALFGFGVIAPQAAPAASAQTEVKLYVVDHLAVSLVQSMAFGRITRGLTAVAETVDLTADGGLVDRAGFRHAGGQVQPAKLRLTTGLQSASNQNVTVKAVALMHGSALQSLPWRSLQVAYKDQSLSARATTGHSLTATLSGVTVRTGGATLVAYGGLRIGAEDPVGVYTGRMTVTVNQE